MTFVQAVALLAVAGGGTAVVATRDPTRQVIVTGFFGQNFAWMVVRLGGQGPFLVLGLGTELAVVVAMLLLFRRRGWL